MFTRVILFSLLIFFCIAGCKKSSEEKRQDSFLSMKINGAIKQYDSCWVTAFQQVGAGSQVYYQNNILCGKPGDYGGLYVNDTENIKAGSFFSSEINSASSTPRAGLGACQFSGSSDIFISYQAGWPLYDITVTITEYNSSYVAGTFNGKLRLIGGTTVLDVTEGQFKAIR